VYIESFSIFQQHGSVWWAKGCNELVSSLDSKNFLHEQFALAFSLLDSPIWMDSSTKKWCKQIEDGVGGPEVIISHRSTIMMTGT
jgi:xylulokinase